MYFLHQCLSTPCLDAIEASHGIHLFTTSGRKLMDFHGNFAHNLGYGHPVVLEAVRHALETLPFCPRRYTNAYAVELAESLARKSPGQLNRVLFAPGGSLAVGMALKLARFVTGRHKVISLWDSFHGASLDAISVGGERLFRHRMGPLLPGCEHAPPPYPPTCPFACGSACNLQCADYVEYLLDQHGDVGAILLEPIRCTDVQIPPADYLPRIREACTRHGALLILDEIPLALGRTGSFYAFESFGVEPDAVVLGKALGGGILPLAALVTRDEYNLGAEAALGHYTHEKSPVASAAALATLAVLESEDLCARAERLGRLFRSQLKELQTRYSLIREIRGQGLLTGVELADPETGEAALQQAETIMMECLDLGLSFKIGKGCVLVLAPPLTIDEADLLRSVAILEEAFSRV
jgi:4-aminobutyrate aminotransferase